MELSKNYTPTEIESKWYAHWLEQKYFASTPDNRPAYTVVIPPPNVTGILHMGHCLNNTIQDILVRRARMTGFNACWVPGTDHASIATEAKVVAMLRERGITKSSLSREEFLSYAWEWKEKYGGIILQQLKKLGCSLDWDRTSFTMDEDYYKAVIKIFVKLHKEGIIYRGLRMVNWDPQSKTALSDEEVIFKEVDSKLYYVKYPLVEDSSKFMMVATTRPETILGDVAICVNPTDERYKAWIGKEVIVPIINRKIPIIADEYVSIDFGTGALKITPAHDKNDNEIGRKHQLKTIDTLDENGHFTASQLMDEKPNEQILAYNGVDRFKLRKLISEDIAALGQIEKIEDYKSQIGTSERTGAVIESRLSLQWFMDMKSFMKNNPEALSAVMNDEIKFHPAKLKNTYNHWLENIKDWCISRQLWWGQQIPAWYDAQGNCIVAENEEEANTEYKKSHGIEPSTLGKDGMGLLKRDEDCLDTWFSSWLWPMEVFKGISNPENADANYYYPTTTLVTGQDIIFFWVARMVMAGYEFKNKLPFKDVYFTGMVRDKQGKKMSKQLGNSPDLLGLIDQYGADAARFGIMISSPAGNDLLFDESSLEQGKFFSNKLWNALKLVKMWEVNQLKIENEQLTIGFATDWFENRLAEASIEVEKQLKEFKLSEALKVIYSLIWDDFCSWYLEWIKPEYGQPIDTAVYAKTISYFESLLELLHPFMPFITEEIYHLLSDKKVGEDICIKQISIPTTYNKSILAKGEILKQTITAIRDVRNKQQLKPKELIQVYIEEVAKNNYHTFERILAKQVNADKLEFITTEIANSISIVNGKDKIYITSEFFKQNSTASKEDLEKDLAHLKGFLHSVEKKLSNEKFVANAKPEVLAIEQKKKADAEEKIKMIEATLQQN
jgi:valyl-tRNA synthetase